MTQSDILDELNDMLVTIDKTPSPTYKVIDYYFILTRAFLEIRKLRHQVKVLEDKFNGQ